MMMNKKKAPPTPKTNDLGAVGKSLMFARTLTLQKIGKAEITKYSEGLVQDNIVVKNLVTYYSECSVKAAKKYYEKTTKYSTAGALVAQAFSDLSTHFAQDKSLGPAYAKLAELQRAIDQLRNACITSFESGFVAANEAFLSGPLTIAREAKNKYRKSKIEYDAVESKLREAQTGTDYLKLYQSSMHSQLYKKRMQNRQHEAETLLHDAIDRHQCEYVACMVNVLTAQYEYYSKVHAKLTEAENYFTQLKEHAEKQRKDWTELKKKRLNEQIEKAKLQEEQKYDSLVKLLSSPDLAVVNAICLSAGSDQEVTLEDLVKILDAYKYTLPILKLGITKEIQSTQSASTLFRGNTTATKLMTAFTRLTGNPYLISVLQPLIKSVAADSAGYEVDPAKVKGGEDVNSNMLKLQTTCRLFVSTIFNSIDSCPLPFREMANHLQKEVVARFPGNRHTSVGGFIFLRFFCPCILSPDAHGIVDASTLNQSARRALILISKSLQNLANGIEFGAKEAYMKDMNRFITDNMEECKVFLDEVATIPPNAENYTPLATIDDVRTKQLPSMHHLMVKNLEKIAKSLTQYNESSYIPTLVTTLALIGDPPQQ